MPQTYYRAVAKLLKAEGWTFHRQAKGSHEIWIGPGGEKLTVHRTLTKRTTANAILKKAGCSQRV